MNTLPPVIIYSGELSLEQLWAFPSFIQWMDTLDRYASSGCRVEWIHVYGGTLFGLRHVQSLFVDARVVDPDGTIVARTINKSTGALEPSLIPCAGMLRSDTAGILFLLTDESTRETFILLVKQERALAGTAIMELPTGIIDPGGRFCGPHADKIIRLLGETLNITELEALNPRRTLASCAVVDQGVHYYLYEATLPREKMRTLRAEAALIPTESGEIEVLVTPYKVEKLPTDDGKLWSAIGLFCHTRPDLLLQYNMVPMPSI